MLTDAVHRAKDDGEHGRLHAEEQRAQPSAVDRQLRISPSERQHQQEARQHKAEPSEEAADTTLSANAEVNAQFVSLGSGQDLHDRQQPIEAAAADPLLLLNQLAPNAGDLSDRPAES
jgi:hypothetical protein